MDTLKEFFMILMGKKITLYTEHLNPTHKSMVHDCGRVLK